MPEARIEARSGGFNFRNASPDIIPPGPTKEEENSTVELGLKTDFADGRVRLNVAAFQNKIKDAQRELNVRSMLAILRLMVLKRTSSRY